MRAKRTKGGATILIMTVVISGALTSVLGVRQVQRITTEPQWVASADLKVGAVITPDQLIESRGKSDSNAIKAPSQLVGKILASDKRAGSPFYMADLKAPPRSWLAQKVPEGRVLYTLLPNNNTIPHTLLRNGDRFDVLVTGRRGVRTVAQDVQLIGALAAGNGKDEAKGRSLITKLTSRADATKGSADNGNVPLIIAVKPGEVYPLANIGANDTVSLVLHGESEVQDGTMLNINPRRVATHQVEVINGQVREQVSIRL